MMKGSMENKIVILCLALFGVLCVNSTALALQSDWPNSPAGTSLDNESNLPILIQYLYEWGIALGGLAVFIVLIIAGVGYLTSFGNPTSMKNALDRIQSAFWGLVFLLSSWLILNIINPDLTTFRPLIMEPPSGEFGACKTDADCEKFGKDYKCVPESGYCAPNLESQFEIEPCKSVTINSSRTSNVTISESGYRTVDISAGESFTFTTNPSDCMGYLELYPRSLGASAGCTGDKQQIIISGGKNSDKAGDTAIRCAELKKIESF